MLESLSVNDLWINLKHVLSTTMDKHILTKIISPNTIISWSKQTHNQLQDINVEPMTRLKVKMLHVIEKFIGN